MATDLDSDDTRLSTLLACVVFSESPWELTGKLFSSQIKPCLRKREEWTGPVLSASTQEGGRSRLHFGGLEVLRATVPFGICSDTSRFECELTSFKQGAVESNSTHIRNRFVA